MAKLNVEICRGSTPAVQSTNEDYAHTSACRVTKKPQEDNTGDD